MSKLTEASCRHKIDQLNVENYKDVEGFNRDNVALFKAIAKVVGQETIIVDSSKHRDRLSLLLANPDLDVFPIFPAPQSQRSDLLVLAEEFWETCPS